MNRDQFGVFLLALLFVTLIAVLYRRPGLGSLDDSDSITIQQAVRGES